MSRIPAPPLSIAMPTRNRPELPERALRSVLEAVGPVAEDIEVAVSDGSDDEATGAVGAAGPGRPAAGGMVGHLRNVATGPGDLGVFARDRLRRPDHGRSILALRAQGEQAPNLGSWVTLASRRDRFGLPVARLDWRPADSDRTSIRASQEVIDQVLRPAGLGHVAFLLGDEHPPALLEGNFHLRNYRVRPKSGDRCCGEPGAVLDGGRSLASAFSGGARNVTLLLELVARPAWRLYLHHRKLDGRLVLRTLIVGSTGEAVVPVTEDTLPVLGAMERLRELIREQTLDCLFVASTLVGPDAIELVARAARLKESR